jgi:hypothetical protein
MMWERVLAPAIQLHLATFLYCCLLFLLAASIPQPVLLEKILPSNSGINPCCLANRDAILPYHKQDHLSTHQACHAHPVSKKLVSFKNYLVAQDKFYYEPNVNREK